jgi:hypothetical protein
MSGAVTGGCQCGGVRYRLGRLGRSSICHCRMCQKATAGIFGIFVTAYEVEWTRGTPARFRSSNKAERLFCAACGTPLAAHEDSGNFEFAIGAFDDPMQAAPVVAVHLESKSPIFDTLAKLPPSTPLEQPLASARDAGLLSFQHPDHETASWTPGINP